MFIKCAVIPLCVIIHLYIEVKAQICERTEVVMVEVPVTYMRRGSLVTHTHQRKTEQRKVMFCCLGYTREDDGSKDSDIVCKPICRPACKNGFCKAPEECACYTGYTPVLSDTHNCLPVCEKGCDHGVCVAPNSCRCNFGYTLVNGTCQPVCTEPCHNGTCTAPETCICLPGYRKSEKNLCEFYCSNGCDNGICSAPETCICNPGWNLTDSYVLSRKICKPFCSIPCFNGDCVAPDTCKCWLGWKLEDNICFSECEFSCGNGICVAPNNCSCFPGYHFDNTTCVPTCVDCSGICLAPNQCLFNEESSERSYEKSSSSSSTKASKRDELSDYYYDYYNEYDHKNDYSVSSPDVVVINASNKDPYDNKTQSSDTQAKPITNSWIQQHWVSILIPLLIIVTAAIVMVLVWRWAPIIVYFKGRSYVVQDDPADVNGSYPFEDIQITPTDSKETKGAQRNI